MPTSRTSRPSIVVEEDPFLRLVGVILDPSTVPERVAAFADFLAHDEPGFANWCAELRARVPSLYPADVRFVDDADQLHAALPHAHAVIIESLRFGPAEIARAPKLKVVQKFGLLTRNIDIAACTAADFEVRTLRRRANIACAEHAFALMLMLARKLHTGAGIVTVERLAKAGRPYRSFDRRHSPNSNWGRLPGVQSLHGSTLGLIGLGEIGREIALRANAFGMNILYHQRTRLAAADEQALSAAYLPLDDLLSRADWVIPQLPAGPSTDQMLNRQRLSGMKRGASIVNVSRPDVLERAAVTELIASGHLGGLALDPPYDTPTKDSDPLLLFPNVILSPQLAGSPRRNALEDFDEMITGIAEGFSV
jgi:phosphoglycerate dehydrogenase-like enzyme